ncbi:Nucleus export protein BRL1 [Escovopsis weberi]|uniref:Nucleus export protein BRL1 n=1 Tax=Escovopsis weberi TaxID=150374 RepID=A0A0M8N3Y8_ESCWE|nr:Nucleus export protein BRL1 [Escovopsis weberi]
MERRTFESHMEWEYQDKGGPVDLTSPFAQAAARRKDNLFSSPSKLATQSTSYTPFGTPSKPPPSTSQFTPQISACAVAPPFRNPAFTTPRNAGDTTLSEVEESPAPTEATEFPNDSPDADRTLTVVGTPMSPSKIDKMTRYSRSPRKFAPGKGDIRPPRETPRKELQSMRKRKRHNLDRDVSSVSRQLYRECWDDVESDSEESISEYVRMRHDHQQQQQQHHGQQRQRREGWFGSMLHTVERYPSAPDSIYQWLQLGLNTCFILFVGFCGYSVIQAVRSDIRNANEKARLEIMSRISECQNHYTANECSKRDRPALRIMCDEWYDCMSQDAEAIMQVKVTAKQLAEIINEFTDAMNMKAWGFFFAIVLIVIFTNFLGRFGNTPHKAVPPPPPPMPPSQPYQPAVSHMSAIAPDATPMSVRSRFQTPRTSRFRMIEDTGVDMDMTMTPGYFTPSRHRSPVKISRPGSPIKFQRSPSKMYQDSNRFE